MATTTTPTERRALPTTLDDIRGMAAIPVYSEDKFSYAGLFDLPRWTAYSDGRLGKVPTIRLGKRVAVPVPALRRMLGDLADNAAV